MATISTTNITSTSFEARATGIDTGVIKNITWYLDGQEWDYEDLSTSDSRSSWIVFDGLNPGTEYYVEASIIYEDGAYWDDISTYVTTLGEVYDPDMSGVYIQQRTADDPTTQIAVRVRGLDVDYSEGDWELHWYIATNRTDVDDATDTVPAGDDRSGTITFTGLTPGTEYLIDVKITYVVNGEWSSFWVDGVYLSTESEGFTFDSATMIAESSNDGTSIIAYVTGLDTNYGRDDRVVRWYLDNVQHGSDEALEAEVPETDIHEFNDLTPGTEYKVQATIYYSSDGIEEEKTVYTYCTTANPRPDYFEWVYLKAQGEDVYITAGEWNALQDNINEVRAYKSYSDYSFTRAYSGDDITATMYNQCISAINTISSSSLLSYKVNAGDALSAEAINNLRDFINGVD